MTLLPLIIKEKSSSLPTIMTIFATIVGKILLLRQCCWHNPTKLRSALHRWLPRASDSAHNRFPQLRLVAWSVSGGTRRTLGKVWSVMCFRPKSRASIDQAPGPTTAKLAPSTANPIGIQGSPGYEKTIHRSTMAINAPASGVHKPTRRKAPAPAPMIWGATGAT